MNEKMNEWLFCSISEGEIFHENSFFVQDKRSSEPFDLTAFIKDEEFEVKVVMSGGHCLFDDTGSCKINSLIN